MLIAAEQKKKSNSTGKYRIFISSHLSFLLEIFLTSGFYFIYNIRKTSLTPQSVCGEDERARILHVHKFSLFFFLLLPSHFVLTPGLGREHTLARHLENLEFSENFLSILSRRERTSKWLFIRIFARFFFFA